MIEKYNIPTAFGNNLDELMQNYEKIISEYSTIKQIDKIDFSSLANNIYEVFDSFKHIIPTMSEIYNYKD